MEREEGGREADERWGVGGGLGMLVRDQTCYKQGGEERKGPDPDRDPASMSVYINLQLHGGEVEGCL